MNRLGDLDCIKVIKDHVQQTPLAQLAVKFQAVNTQLVVLGMK